MQYVCTTSEGPARGESWLTERLEIYVNIVLSGQIHAYRLGSLVGMAATYLYDDPAKIALAKRPNLPKEVWSVYVSACPSQLSS